MTAQYSEEVIHFGRDDKLVGILSKPMNAPSNSPALIVANSGVLHRVGPCRFAVKLARNLAAQGHAVFRMDYSGIGDSGFGPAGNDVQDNNTVELVQAMDHLESLLGVNQFVIHGLCSGARDAFNAAIADHRVVGISQVDGFSYRTRKWYLNKIKEKFASFSEFAAFIGRRVSSMFKRDVAVVDSADPDMSVPQWPEDPPREVAAAGYRKLASRNVKLLVAYTSAWQDTYNYENQFLDMYAGVNFGDNVALHYMPEADHVMTNPVHADELIAAIRVLLTG